MSVEYDEKSQTLDPIRCPAFLIFYPSSQIRFFFLIFFLLDIDPCYNVSCKYYSHCQASSAQQYSCVCERSCPSYDEQVCASNGRTFNNLCSLKKEICETQGNYTQYHPGSCTGIRVQSNFNSEVLYIG